MEKVGVYFHGNIGRHNYWYSVELQMPTTKTNAGKRKRSDSQTPQTLQEIRPVATMYDATVGRWAVIGHTIYCIGGFRYKENESTFVNNLLKHNTKHSDPSFWDIESSAWNIPRVLPFVAALDTNKLCVVSGHHYIPDKVTLSDFESDSDSSDVVEGEGEGEGVGSGSESESESESDSDSDEDEDELLKCERKFKEDYENCGEVYDVGTQCWKLLDAKYSDFKKYKTYNQAAVIEKDGEQPTQIVFYGLYHGVIHVLDVTSGGTSKPPERHKDFALWSFFDEETLPRGLTDPADFSALQFVTNCVSAVFANDTFYWFTPTMRLYGYDTLAQTWLQSSSLIWELPPVISGTENARCLPFLIHLPNGKFLLTIPAYHGVLSMAFLTVHKAASFLDVSVDLVPSFEFSHKDFMPTNGKAVSCIQIPAQEVLFYCTLMFNCEETNKTAAYGSLKNSPQCWFIVH